MYGVGETVVSKSEGKKSIKLRISMSYSDRITSSTNRYEE
jgi:hypothetical protein